MEKGVPEVGLLLRGEDDDDDAEVEEGGEPDDGQQDQMGQRDSRPALTDQGDLLKV